MGFFLKGTGGHVKEREHPQEVRVMCVKDYGISLKSFLSCGETGPLRSKKYVHSAKKLKGLCHRRRTSAAIPICLYREGIRFLRPRRCDNMKKCFEPLEERERSQALNIAKGDRKRKRDRGI